MGSLQLPCKILLFDYLIVKCISGDLGGSLTCNSRGKLTISLQAFCIIQFGSYSFLSALKSLSHISDDLSLELALFANNSTVSTIRLGDVIVRR